MFPRPGKALSGVFVLEQAKSLARNGIAVTVVSPRPRRPLSLDAVEKGRAGRGTPRCADVDGIPVLYMDYPHVPLRLSTRFEAWSLTNRLRSVVRREHEASGIDLLHAHQLFPTGYAAAVVGRELGIPVVCTAHGSDVHTHPHRNRGIARYTRAALRSLDRVVAVSQDLSRRIELLEPRSAPVEVIYNGVDPRVFGGAEDKARLRRELGLPLGGIGICTVSRLASAKGIPELVSAFRTVLKETGEAWLVIAGDGPLREDLHAWAARLDGRLIVAGPVAHSRVPDYLNACDVFALPSHQEGVPVAMLEAMACGLPVVASAVGGIPEAVVDGHTGFLIEPRDEEALFRRLLSLVQDAGAREAMGAAAAAVIGDRFHWQHGSEQLVALYAGLRRSGPAPRQQRSSSGEAD